eukprot:scaffold24982_cov65-Attheya_sp.AAC.4
MKLQLKNPNVIFRHQVKSNLKAFTNDLDNCMDDVYVKVTAMSAKTDIQGVKLDIDDLEAFQEEVNTKLDQVPGCRPTSLAISSDNSRSSNFP